MTKKQIGKIGEDMACNYLLQNNYKIIDRNFHCRQGEIDIIAVDNTTKEMVFIEVKSRNNKIFGRGIEAIDNYKLRHIIIAAKYYLFVNKINFNIRIDAIEIDLKLKKINHIKQIL